MKKILLINGKKEFGHSKDALNQYLNDIAYDHLKSLGHDVKLTIVDDDYNIDDEIQKWLWADTIIYQMPGWWMGPPWIIKKYIDEVLLQVMVLCMLVMVDLGMILAKNMALVVYFRVKLICCR